MIHKLFTSLPFLKLSEELAARWNASSSKDEHIPLYEESIYFAMQAIVTTSYGKLFERHEDFIEMKSLYDYVSRRRLQNETYLLSRVCWESLERWLSTIVNSHEHLFILYMSFVFQFF